jgi:small subunit ribosomal protein S11
MAAEDCSKVAIEAGLKRNEGVYVGDQETDVSLPSFFTQCGIVTEIIDVALMPHNGCRPPKGQ